MEQIKSILAPEEVNFIVYHGQCCDGFGAALSGYLLKKDGIKFYEGRFSAKREDEDLIRAVTDLGLTEKVNMVIVDFSYAKHFMDRLNQMCNSLILLDHHISAQNELRDLPYCYFDQNRSGCTIAWEYFIGNTMYPRLLQMIEDRDLWRWQVKDSRAFTTAFYSMVPYSFEKYKEFIDHPELVDDFIARGQLLMDYTKQQVIAANESTYYFVNKSGQKLAIINLTSNGSEYGEYVTVSGFADYALTWVYDHSKKRIKVGIRSAKGSNNDCSILAQRFNGGGHFNAAGFVFDGCIEELVNRLKF